MQQLCGWYGSFLVHFGFIFGQFYFLFWFILVSFLIQFGFIFGSFWFQNCWKSYHYKHRVKMFWPVHTLFFFFAFPLPEHLVIWFYVTFKWILNLFAFWRDFNLFGFWKEGVVLQKLWLVHRSMEGEKRSCFLRKLNIFCFSFVLYDCAGRTQMAGHFSNHIFLSSFPRCVQIIWWRVEVVPPLLFS